MDFAERRKTALAILGSQLKLTRKAGSFLGQLVVDATPLSVSQSEWFEKLNERFEQSQQGVN